MKFKITNNPTGKRIRVHLRAHDSVEEAKAEDMALSKRKLEALEPSSMQETVSLIRQFMKRDIPVMLLGSSGFGKSALIREAATNIPGFSVKAENVKDIRAGQMNVEDLKGLPKIVKGEEGDVTHDFTKSTVPDWLKEVILKPNENFVLFFDELNHASPAVLNAVYGIILERTIDDYDFNGRVRIAAAGNKADQNEDLSELSDPLIRRFEIIDIDKAIDVEISQEDNFYTSWLNKKYEDRIPESILKLVFAADIETGDSRSIDRILKAWSEDIAEGEEVLTRSSAIPAGLQVKIQKIYRDQFFKTSGSEKHKELINQVTDYVKKLKETNPEFFKSTMTAYNAIDLINKDLSKGEAYSGSGTNLSQEGKEHVYAQFSSYQPEFIEAALNKVK